MIISRYLIKILLALFFIPFLFLRPLLASNEALLGPAKDLFQVDEIKIVGNKKVEQEAILQKINISPGELVDNYQVRSDLKRIYSMNYFESVEIHHERKSNKNILIYKVLERPIISKIKFDGHDEFSESDLEEVIKTKAFTILNVTDLNADIEALKKHYEEKGYYLAKIHFEIEKVDDENVEVTFKINEFHKVRIKKITFIGNRIFSDVKLKSMMETREESFLSNLSGSGNFKEKSFEIDIERLKYFYKTNGHLQVNVSSPQITVSEDKKWVFISIKIQEGPKFNVHNIRFSGDLELSEEELRGLIKLKENEVYSEDKLRKDIQKLTEKYQDLGYAFVNVLRTLQVVPGENKVDVEFIFEKGKLAYIGKINIIGNNKTRDKVIRRELKIREGMKYSGTALRESKENVDRLGFFEPTSVIFQTKTRQKLSENNIVDVEISVKERNTGQLSIGAGYSTATKFFLQSSISQNNFLGRGQNLSLSFSLASRNKIFNLGFTEPYFLDSKWTLGGDVFHTDNNLRKSLRFSKTGADVRVGHPVSEFGRLFVTYKWEEIKLKEMNNPLTDASVENGVSSSVRTSYIVDKRNNRFEPSKGYYFRLSAQYTGLGGDQQWTKTGLEGRFYRKLWGDFVFRSRLDMQKLFSRGNRKIPLTERFTLGGARDLRGYRFDDIGPIVVKPVSDGQGGSVDREFNEGGLFSLVSTFEIEHPLVREARLKWVVFFDAGNVYANFIGEDGRYTLRTDYGFGFRWFSPIGVLRFEFGYPINKKDREAPSQFYFDIGQLF